MSDPLLESGLNTTLLLTQAEDIKVLPATTVRFTQSERQRPSTNRSESANAAANQEHETIFAEYPFISKSVQEAGRQAVQQYQEFYQAENNPIHGYEYHNEFHSIAFAKAGLDLIKAINQKQAQSPDFDFLGLTNELRHTYDITDLDEFSELLYLVAMVHDLGDIGTLSVQDGQIKMQHHTDEYGNPIHRSGLVAAEVDGQRIDLRVEALVASQMPALIREFYKDKDLPQDKIDQYIKLATDMVLFTVFPPDRIESPLHTFVQLVDQVGQAHYNAEPFAAQQLGLLHEWEAEGKLEAMTLTPEQTINFHRDRQNKLIGDDSQAAQLVNQIWGQYYSSVDRHLRGKLLSQTQNFNLLQYMEFLETHIDSLTQQTIH